jgi:hypothetical protein
MGYRNNGADDLDAKGAVVLPFRRCRDRMGQAGQNRCLRHVIWPPDALTRLLMQADGVTEDVLDSLLRRVAGFRALD